MLCYLSKVTPIHFEYNSDEVGVCHFFTKLVAMATKTGQDRSSALKTLSFGVKIEKIGPADPEILVLVFIIEPRTITLTHNASSIC